MVSIHKESAIDTLLELSLGVLNLIRNAKSGKYLNWNWSKAFQSSYDRALSSHPELSFGTHFICLPQQTAIVDVEHAWLYVCPGSPRLDFALNQL